MSTTCLRTRTLSAIAAITSGTLPAGAQSPAPVCDGLKEYFAAADRLGSTNPDALSRLDDLLPETAYVADLLATQSLEDRIARRFHTINAGTLRRSATLISATAQKVGVRLGSLATTSCLAGDTGPAFVTLVLAGQGLSYRVEIMVETPRQRIYPTFVFAPSVDTQAEAAERDRP